jgi:hypothetical protein
MPRDFAIFEALGSPHYTVTGSVQLLILDRGGLERVDAAARRDFLEILAERCGRR